MQGERHPPHDQLATEGSGLHIRRHEESDHDQVWRLHNDALKSTGADYDAGPWADDLNRIREVYFSNGEFLVGEDDGRIVAMGAIRRRTPDCAEVKRMRVHPEHQRKGFGKQILDALEHRAIELGYSRLGLDTAVQLVPAQQLYLHNGFQETGRGRLGGFEVIYYEKAIGSRPARQTAGDGAEERLAGGNMADVVVRVGDTVRRPAGPWTPTVHMLLHFLADQGFEGAPRPLGMDSKGREVLTFAEGVLVHDHKQRIESVEGLQQVARLIRSLHELTAGLVGHLNGPWREDFRDPSPTLDIICHNDLGPWNLIANDDDLVFIDWDLAAPGRRLWDLGWAAIGFIPLLADSNLGPEETAERIRSFSSAYGLARGEEKSLLEVAAERAQHEAHILFERGGRGEQPHARLLKEGHADFWRETVERIAANLPIWSDALDGME